MTRPLTLPERRLVARALLHLATEYMAASVQREQMGDGRSARMRMIRHAADAQELALLINGANTVEIVVAT